MQNGVIPAAADPSVSISEAQERRVVWLLCLLAAVQVFIFSAAFPFFSNVDESHHFDVMLQYARGRVPHGLELMTAESMRYIALYGSQEYFWATNSFPGGQYPPPAWTQPPEVIQKYLLANEAARQKIFNYEDGQPPLYYLLTGGWWQVGQWCGFEGGRRLYWVRFFNLFLMGTLVWLGYAATRLIFPERRFVRLGVAALLAFIPQTAFHSIENDTLSPVCFGLVFIGLVQWLRADVPGIRLGIGTGLALAATFLTKISDLPLLAVAAVVVGVRGWNLCRAGKWRAAFPALLCLVLCAGLPMLGWLVWMKHVFGDWTGAAAKIHVLEWTLKPFSEWWQHPIFTPHGLWTFVSALLATLWQGEFLWHLQPPNLPVVDTLYAISSIVFVGVAAGTLLARSAVLTATQRRALWLAVGSVVAAMAFLGFLSILYDFGKCFYPSREFPYFATGRLMLGALVPFLLLYVYGLDRLLGRVKNRRVRPAVLAGLILFMLISRMVTTWPVFCSQYNWFHM
jgi:hypothetical protein